MAFKLQTLVKHYDNSYNVFQNKQLFLSDLCTTITSSNEWNAAYVGDMNGDIDTPASSSTDHAGVLISGADCLIQGFEHNTTGAKLLFIYGSAASFNSALYLNSNLVPCGLSVIYIPPFKNQISWPDDSNIANWGVSEGLKIISLANSSATVNINVIDLQIPNIAYKFNLLFDGDTIGIIQDMYQCNGSNNTRTGDYWPLQRKVGLFAGKIFDIMGDTEDEIKYGAFLLQPIADKREYDLPDGLGFWLNSVPAIRSSLEQTAFCPFIWWDSEENLVDSKYCVYSYDTNLLKMMSTTGYRFVPLAVGLKNPIPTTNDLKGYLDTDLFRMVSSNLTSGTTMANISFNVIGGGLAIAWDSSNTNFLDIGRPTSYSNSIGAVGKAATINYNIRWDLVATEEWDGEDDFTTSGDAGSSISPQSLGGSNNSDIVQINNAIEQDVPM